MSVELNILPPGMMAVPEVLKDLNFSSAGEALVVFALIFSGGKTSDTLAALPEFNAGLVSLQAKGAISVEGSKVLISLDPLQEDMQ